MTPDEEIASVVGGNEANAILASGLRSRWIQRGALDVREAGLYLLSAHNLTWYIWSASLGSSPANDVLNYLTLLNQTRFVREPLELSRLKRQAAINLLSPFSAFALYGLIVGNIWSGNNEVSIPAVGVAGGRYYLPEVRLVLAPYGPEVSVDNLFSRSGRVWAVSLRRGIETRQAAVGTTLSVRDGWRLGRLTLGPFLSMWDQPAMAHGGATSVRTSSGLGAAATMTASIDPGTRASFYFWSQLGYKTDGFLEGEPLARGVLLHAGLKFVEPR